jgi:predicted nucleotidyltransferase component of viral defense system
MKMDRERITNRILTFMHRQGYIKKRDNRQSFITDSYYFNYINTGGNSDHIKVDINYVMRAHIYEPKPRMLVTDEFEIDGGVNALNSIEIYGSKINALNNRAAVRDLYDIWKYVAEDRAYNSFEQLKKAVIFYHVLTSESITGNFSLLATNKLN